MSNATSVGFFGRIKQDMGMTSQFLKARSESHKLAARRGQCQAQLQAAYEALGGEAIQARVGRDTPAFVEADRCQQTFQQAQAALDDRQSAFKTAQEEMVKKTATLAATAEALHGEQKAAEATAAGAKKALHAAQSQLVAIDSQIKEIETKLQTLAQAAQNTDTDAALTDQLAALSASQKDIQTRQTQARQKLAQSAAAVDAKAEELRRADKAWQGEQAQIQKELSALAAAPTPDAAATAAAQERLAARKQAHEQAAGTINAEIANLTQARQADQSAADAIDKELAAVQGQVRSVQDVVAVRQLQRQLGEQEKNRTDAAGTLADAQGQAEQADKLAAAKAQQVQQARQEHKDAVAAGQALVASSQAGVEEGGKNLQAATTALTAAKLALGRQLHEKGDLPTSLQPQAAAVTNSRDEAARIDARLAELKTQMDCTRAPAYKMALIGAATAVLLVAIIVGVLWLMGVFGKRSAPAPAPSGGGTANQASATPAGGPSGTRLVQPPAMTAQQLEEASRAKLATIAGAIKAYRFIHDDQSPAKLSALYSEGMVPDTSVFVYADTTTLPARADIDAKTDFTTEPLPGAPGVVVREKKPRHKTGEVLAVVEDGSVKFVAAP